MSEGWSNKYTINDFETFLGKWFSEKDIFDKELKESMEYSLFSGGKRIRPLLFFTLLEDLSFDDPASYYFASALECIHTYSLIHDDLPAMDDDTYRRGKLTTHKKFNEALAILAGDGLLNESIELALRGIEALPIDLRERGFMAASFLFKASGTTGMIDGQALDIREGSSSQNIVLYKKKTGALLGASLAMAASLAKGNIKLAHELYSIGETLGVSYQLQDDRFDTIEDGLKVQESYLHELSEKSQKYTMRCFEELDGLEIKVKQLKKLILQILKRKE